MLFSLLLPFDFFYESKNNANLQDPVVIIKRGLLLKGTINKTQLGAGHFSLITLLLKEYGIDRCLQFIDNVQFLTNAFGQRYGFSVGIKDCQVTRYTEIQDTVAKSFLQAQHMESSIRNPFLKEAYVTRSLGSARDMGMLIAKNALAEDNNFMKTVLSGAKGDYFNISQITGLLGQQNVDGDRVKPLLTGKKRSLYHYPVEIESQDIKYEAAGFIRNSFIHGLNPKEYYFHMMTGRLGIIDTALKTSSSGYIQRRMVKIAEDVQVRYDNTVRNSTNSILQFVYGDNGLDPTKSLVIDNKIEVCNIQRLADRLNYNYELKNNLV